VNRLTSRGAAAASTLLLLATAACGGGGDSSDSAQPADDSNSQSNSQSNSKSDTQAASTLETARSEFGPILVDSKGMTLYMFDPDQGGQSTCDAECLQAWPPVEGPAAAGKGVDDSLLGTTKATDGARMATYNDWPLYYWAQDQQPGDVTGQAVGDVWWVVNANGKPIRQAPQG
jgi:predicted lipoprotein with Yx(FWY)xxD motif